MDGMRFDRLTKRLATSGGSRRGLIRFGLGGGLGILVSGQMADDALACSQNGKPCDKSKKNGGNCCSGTCRKGKCRPTPGAAGCTVRQDLCTRQPVPCPNNRFGLCVVLDSGKPFCIQSGRCEPCTSGADCTELQNGKCLKSCPSCNAESGGKGCFYP